MTISQDTSAPLVAVVGATGTQGGSVIKALSASKKPCRIRGFTRDTSKPAAQELIKQGTEMVAVTLIVENKDQVFKAFEGAAIVFAMTDFWSHLNMEREIAEGKMFIDAAVAAKVRLFIWSGLSHAEKHSGGKYVHIDHFTGKGIVTEYGKSVPGAEFSFVNVEAGLYMSNFTTSAPQKQEDGSFVFAMPVPGTSVAPLLDTASDYGLKSIEGSQLRDIYAHGEVISYENIVAQFAAVTGKKITYKEVSKDEYINFLVAAGKPQRIALELYEMFAYIYEIGYFGVKDIDGSRAGLEQDLHTWAEYAKATDWSKVLN
ncbi:hypothetical protein FRB94_005379 [Tulasnella sp. JGI-2019a]|nr:hypothetical protein FRB94_005379 [Tulasnella sp. JGI-2019a]